MYLPTNPNSCTREINSRRRSAAATSFSTKIIGLGQQRPDGKGMIRGTSDLPLFHTSQGYSRNMLTNSSGHHTYKHGKEGQRLLCPWCISESSLTPRSSNSDIFTDETLTKFYFKNDVSRELYVLDDRLYDYIEKHPAMANIQEDGEEDSSDAKYIFNDLLGPGQFLRYCVKVSHLVSALTDDDYFLECGSDESSNFNLTTNVIDKDTDQASKHDCPEKYGNYRKVMYFD